MHLGWETGKGNPCCSTHPSSSPQQPQHCPVTAPPFVPIPRAMLTCHVLDSMGNLLVRGGGHGAEHLLQVWHSQVGVGAFPPPHRGLLAHLLFGGLSVHLSQVRALCFGQLALCSTKGERKVEPLCCDALVYFR